MTLFIVILYTRFTCLNASADAVSAQAGTDILGRCDDQKVSQIASPSNSAH